MPGTTRATNRPPICPPCFKTFKSAFVKVNGKLPAERQENDEQLTIRAARRAQAVRFGTEWACPRCTKLEDAKGNELMLTAAYPNRAARRAGAKANRLNKNKRTRKAA